jgi:large subunit ribosomal protein L13
MTKTQMVKHKETSHEWYVIDAAGKILGRTATQIATLLSGKYRPDFTPNVDNGAGVIVLNCGKIRITGKKAEQKDYKRFSGYPGGQTVTKYDKMMEKDPKYILRHAVKGMLPKNKLGDLMLKRLKLYPGETHPHIAQKPVEKKI